MTDQATTPLRGIDWAFDPPKISSLAPAGIKFAVRYTSPGTNPKNLTKSELQALLAAGLHVCLVFESTSGRMRGGHDAGTADAKVADTACFNLGMASLPVYFAADWDVQPAELAACDAYLDGVASVIGRARTGIYGGLRVVTHAFGNKKAAYVWQTYAWSGGVWLNQAQLRQVKNGVPLGGGTVDMDEAHAADYGQWPRPKPPGPQPFPSGRHVVDADSPGTLAGLAKRQGCQPADIWAETAENQPSFGVTGWGDLQRAYLNAGGVENAVAWQAKMPAGMILYLP